MHIGPIQPDSVFFLAPLAGYSDLPFRLLCKQFGAGICFSEMISCNGLVYGQENTYALLASIPEERPVGMQLFGNEPEIMADAAAIVSSHPVDLIDINMGCPVKKVVKRGAGAALMKEPDLARRIIAAVRRATDKAVTVKIRTGWDRRSINACEIARIAEDNGADAVTVHGRTWSDGFGGSVDLEAIAAVKKALSIPVIGNGDIHTQEDGLTMMAKTGCDAVMIGRGALGAPWIFGNETDLSVGGRARALARHLEFIVTYASGSYPLARIKNHAGRYFKGSRDAASIRKQIYSTTSLSDLNQFITELCIRQEEG